jgi:hypothetical protein
MYQTNITCPICYSNINIKKFGDGWIGICCDEIIYNSDQLPWTEIPETVKTEKKTSHRDSLLMLPGKQNQGLTRKLLRLN